MNEAVATRAPAPTATAQSLLRASAISWLVPALIGQWFFCYHIARAFLVPALSGDAQAWNRDLFVGLVPGDAAGNFALGAHLFLAFVLTVGATFQLVPQVRAQAPAFHRWNGRVFIACAWVTSLAGIYMIWTRDTFGGILVNDISVSLNGVLILVFATIALRHARAHRFDRHQRWALRTFMVVSGVYFVRVMYAFLGRVTGGEIPGVTDTMTGPTNVVLGFASYLLPLAVLELYFLAKRSASAPATLATAALVFAMAAATAIGVYGRALRWLA